MGKSAAKLRIILLGALALALLYTVIRVTATQLVDELAPASHSALVTHLPTFSQPLATARAAPATIVLTASNVVSSVVDMTEDYKALGYTDNRKVVRDDQDNLYVAYRKKWHGVYRIFIAKSTDQGKRWTILNGKQPVETIGDYTQRVPSLAIGRNAKDDNNFLHLVWYGNDSAHVGNERQIKYLRLTTAGKLSSGQCCFVQFNIPGYDEETLWQEHPAIYTNGSNVYLVWEGRDAITANAKIKFVRSTDFGQSWTAPSDIAPATAINFSRPTLAVTYQAKTRQLYVLAYGEQKGISQIYWTRSLDNGAQWADWQAVSPTKTDQRHVSLARDDTDKLHVVWREETAEGDGTVLRYRVFDPTLAKGAGDWQAAAETIGAQPGHCLFFPSVAVDETQRVWVTWTESSDCHTLPNDDPTSGQIVYRVKSSVGKWGNPTRLSAGDAQLYASLRSAHAPSGTAMDLVWLDVSQCASAEATASPSDSEDNANTPSTDCVIHYTSLK